MEFSVKPEPENPRLTREMRGLDQDGREMQIRVAKDLPQNALLFALKQYSERKETNTLV